MTLFESACGSAPATSTSEAWLYRRSGNSDGAGRRGQRPGHARPHGRSLGDRDSRRRGDAFRVSHMARRAAGDRRVHVRLGAMHAKMLRMAGAMAIRPIVNLAWRWLVRGPVADLTTGRRASCDSLHSSAAPGMDGARRSTTRPDASAHRVRSSEVPNYNVGEAPRLIVGRTSMKAPVIVGSQAPATVSRSRIASASAGGSARL